MFPYLKTIPKFYQDVILSHNKSKILSSEDFHENIKNQLIWCNKYIKSEGKTLLFKRWIEDGIVMLKNLRLNNNGILDVALSAAKINISIEPCRDIDVPVYVHKSDEFYEWPINKSNYYYNNLIVDIIEPPTSQKNWSKKNHIIMHRIIRIRKR